MTPQTWEGWYMMHNHVTALSQYYKRIGFSLARLNNPDDMNVQEMYLKVNDLDKLANWIEKRINKYNHE